MNIIATDQGSLGLLRSALEAYDCPAILLAADYKILAMNKRYKQQFGDVELKNSPTCFQVSHGYQQPCDREGEDCPLASARLSGHKERVLHIHQTPRGKEMVDVELIPLTNDQGEFEAFIELLHPVQSAEKENESQMVGSSQAFLHMLQKISRVSESDASVLLLGESGTGKELAARAIHSRSARQHKTIVSLECAGLHDALFESELFGHVKGAFTGANSNHTGMVELADGGTLFLDEIGDVPLPMQVKLLRLLETGTYRPLGSGEVKHSNFRLVCATNKNLEEMVEQGSFRLDLYYRINIFPIEVPALRQRREDIPLLVNILLERIQTEKKYFLSAAAIRALQNYAFPGNIRELKNILTRSALLSNTSIIEEPLIRESLPNIKSTVADNENWVDLKTAEARYLKKLMQAHNNNKAVVAEVAGLSLRSLYRKLKSMPDMG